MSRALEILTVPAHDPAAILPALEEAIVGKRSLLPVPSADRTRRDLLLSSMMPGQEIDPAICLVVATSGSTGRPKGAQLTAINLISSADATHQYLGGPGQWLLAMPAHHIAGIQVLVRSLVAGVDPEVLDVSQGFDISAFARAADSLAATGDRTYTSLAPNQLAKALDTVEGIDALRQFTAILVGGAPTNPQHLEAARRLGITVVTTYGSSETSGGCVYDGHPLPGAQVRLDEHQGQGRISLGGPMIAAGYRNYPEHLAFATPGWFHTSDSGVLDNGRLSVTGRLDAVIISGGLKIHPEVMEKEILKVDGVKETCVVGIPHPRFGQAVVAVYTGSAQRGDILENLDHLPRWQMPKEILQVEALPLIGPGKVNRSAVTQMVQDLLAK